MVVFISQLGIEAIMSKLPMEKYEASGRGAVFRCDSNGSNFEVYAMGLRNPQELAFDNHGNLFTFDNTGDIGDKARVVYVLDNTDSGWDMAHQSPHHYANALDWGILS